MTRRERLEDAFERADGAQEVAFRHYQRAVRMHRQERIALWVSTGKTIHRNLVAAALNLSTFTKDASK